MTYDQRNGSHRQEVCRTEGKASEQRVQQTEVAHPYRVLTELSEPAKE